jgi:RNA polymerase sigma-70 factor (ECF subfamily)
MSRLHGHSRPALPDPAGDAAFDVLFRSNYAALCRFVLPFVRSRAVAEELVQDLFFAIWQRPDRGAAPEISRTYLYTAARNRAISYLRHERIQERWAAGEVVADRAELGADDDLQQAELESAVYRAIDELPPRCRLVFTMHRQQRLTYAAIAEALQISVKSVEAHIGRALAHLRAALGPYLAPSALLAIVGSLARHATG